VRPLLPAVVVAVLLLPATAAAEPDPPPTPPPVPTVGWVAPLAGRLQVTRAFDPPASPYGPVGASVAAGQAVARGSPLGTLVAGHGGCPVAACLHFGVRRGETYLDPLALLRPPRVRLLPLGPPVAPAPAPGRGWAP
jgi:hypothetical protein